MKYMSGLSLAAALVVSMAGSGAEAGYIDYTYTTTLSLASGTDTAGLAGATIVVDARFTSTDVYTSLFGFPDATADLGATYTISGSSVAANDGTFAFPQVAFFPTFAGLFTATQGDFPTVILPVGGTLELLLNTNPSTRGAMAQVGQTINVLDFAPATSVAAQFKGTSANYNQVTATVNAVLVPGTVPEPSSLAMCGIAGMVGLVVVGTRRRRA